MNKKLIMCTFYLCMHKCFISWLIYLQEIFFFLFFFSIIYTHNFYYNYYEMLKCYKNIK